MGKDKKQNEISYSSAGWSDALCHVPMVMYQFFGDKEILETVYEPLKKFVEFNRQRATKKHVRHLTKMGAHYKYILDTGFHFGEWLEPGSVMMKDAMKALVSPDEEVATAWFYHTVKEVSEMARILGKDSEAEEYAALAEAIKMSYKKEFLKNGKVDSKRQCRYVRPVHMGIVTGDEAQALIDTLAQMVKDNEYKIGTGFLTTWKVMQVLCDYGHVDTAYKLLLNEKCPGWIYEIRKGATTTWENWLGINEEGIPADSLNHYAPGAMLAWFFSYCAGIRPAAPAFKEILIQPVPGGNLTWARASYKSVSGLISSAWEIKGGEFILNVVIPEGCKATVKLPDGTEIMNATTGVYKCSVCLSHRA